jgi:hypothetical protein
MTSKSRQTCLDYLECSDESLGFAHIISLEDQHDPRAVVRPYTRYNSGLDACTNSHHMRADVLEELVWGGGPGRYLRS